MNWIVDKTALKREGAQEVLNCLPIDFPGVEDAQQALAHGEFPAHILRRAWEAYREKRKQEIDRLAVLYNEVESLKQTLEIYRGDPVHAELSRTQTELKAHIVRAERAEQGRAGIQEKLERLQRSSQQEIDQLKKLVIDQNGVIAKQRKELRELTGDTQPE